MLVTAVINAGGASTRMGPWAPAPKQFLPLGPWDPVHEQGIGPSNIWRLLYLFTKLESEFANRVTLSKAVVINPQDHAAREVLHEMRTHFNFTILTDPEPNWGTMGFLHSAELEGGVLMHNSDDILPYIIIREVLREALGEIEGAAPAESVNVLAVADCEQSGQYGELAAYVHHITPEEVVTGYFVKEKPLLAHSLVGCGLMYMNPETVARAKLHPEWRNSSSLINALKASGNPIGLAAVGVGPGMWKTFNTPKEYRQLCDDRDLCDEAWDAWKLTQE